MQRNTLPMKSETRSPSESPLMVPVISSFSTIGRKSWTNSEVYGGAIDSRTCRDKISKVTKKVFDLV